MAAPAVRLDDLQLTVVPGEGLVGRFGEVALLALSGGSGAAVDQLLATCRALGHARIDEPGAILVDQLDALLGERMPASPSFCVLATSSEGVEVVLCGEVEVTRCPRRTGAAATPDPIPTRGSTSSSTKGSTGWSPCRSARPSRRAMSASISTTVSSPAAACDSRSATALPGEAPPAPTIVSEPTAAWEAAPPVPDPGARDGRGRAGGGSSRCRSGVPRHRQSATPCPWPPRRSTSRCPSLAPCSCRPCAAPRAMRTTRRPVTARTAAGRCSTAPPGSWNACSPHSGLLLLDDGSSYTLDAGYLIGCLPDLANSLSRGDVRPLVLPERDGVAATHAEVVLDGWAVTVTDRALDADTWVRRPGDREWVRLTHGRPEGIVAESQIRVGERVLTFVAARRISGDEHSR